MKRFFTLSSALKRPDQSDPSLNTLSRSKSCELSFPLPLNAEQQTRLDFLQQKLVSLYEELDQLLVKEEQLVCREYENRRRPRPLSAFVDSGLGDSSAFTNGRPVSMDLSCSPTRGKIRTVATVRPLSTEHLDVREEFTFDANTKQVDSLDSRLTASMPTLAMQAEATSSASLHSNEELYEVKDQQHADRTICKNDKQQEQLHSQIYDLQEALNRVARDKQELKQHVQSTNDATQQLRSERDLLKRKLTDQQNQIQELHDRLNSCEYSRNSLQSQADQLRQDLVTEREKFLAYLTSENEAVEEQLRSQLQYQQSQSASLRRQLAEARSESSRQQQRLSARAVALQEQNSMLLSQLAEARLTLGDHLKKATSLQRSSQVAAVVADAELQVCARQLLLGVEQIQQKLVHEDVVDTSPLALLKNSKCTQINGKVDQQRLLAQLEKLVMRNMRNVIDTQLTEQFERLEQSLAQLKFDMIETALKKDQVTNGFGGRDRGTRWARWASDMNNNEQSNAQKITSGNLKAVQKKMNELRNSMETYLRSYFVRILMELQEQQASLV